MDLQFLDLRDLTDYDKNLLLDILKSKNIKALKLPWEQRNNSVNNVDFLAVTKVQEVQKHHQYNETASKSTSGQQTDNELQIERNISLSERDHHRYETITKASNDFSGTPTDLPPSAFGAPSTAANRSYASLFKKNSEKVPQTSASSNPVADTINQNGSPQTPNCYRIVIDDPDTIRIGEFLTAYRMNGQTVSLFPRGLTNRNNYCYLNSILQSLLACSPFYNLLKALPLPQNRGKNSTTPLIDNVVRFVREFEPVTEASLPLRKDKNRYKRGGDTARDIYSGAPFEPSYIHSMLQHISSTSSFSVEGRQEDAEEFLSCLLNGINDEMLQVMDSKNKGTVTQCTEFERTPLSDIFRGQLRSTVSRAGQRSTNNVQPFFTLQLDVQKAGSVRKALEILVEKEQLEGMTCSKTRQPIEAWKQITLEELPVILILHLKWFVYTFDRYSNGYSKLLKSMEFPVDLKIDGKFLSPNTAKKVDPEQKQYKLFAVTYHDGREATQGHYFTDAFHAGYGSWIRYNDSTVKGVSESNVLRPTSPRVPYLLYYRRCDTIGKDQPNNAKPH